MHKNIKKQVWEKLKKTNSSFLFYGIEGVGKNHTTLELVKTALCPDLKNDIDACNKCDNCVRINKNTHPNIIFVEPENRQIKIDRIREIVKALTFSPAENHLRFVIIRDAHRLNKESANALLKTLEEPPEKTVFILLSSNLHKMLPTIISRCELVKFAPLSEEKISQIKNIPVEHPLIKYAMGSASKMDFFINNEEVINRLIGYLKNPDNKYSGISKLCSDLLDIADKDIEIIEYIFSLIITVLTKKSESLAERNLENTKILNCIKELDKTSTLIYTNVPPANVLENMLLNVTSNNG